MKKCSKCEKTKEDDEFYKTNRLKSGLSSLCKDCISEQKRIFYKNNKKEILSKINQHNRTEYMQDWRKNNPEKVKESRKKQTEKLRLEVLTHYGGDPPKCACCGEPIIQFLTIDHINNDGAKYRKARIYSYTFYRWLKQNNYPERIVQVLCMNCNTGKMRNKGICPHKESGTY